MLEYVVETSIMALNIDRHHDRHICMTEYHGKVTCHVPVVQWHSNGAALKSGLLNHYSTYTYIILPYHIPATCILNPVCSVRGYQLQISPG